MSRITKKFGLDLATPAGMSTFFVLAQAAAEYGSMTARQMSSTTPARSFQQAVDDARGYVSDHSFAVILAAIVVFALLRFVFTAPRVR